MGGTNSDAMLFYLSDLTCYMNYPSHVSLHCHFVCPSVLSQGPCWACLSFVPFCRINLIWGAKGDKTASAVPTWHVACYVEQVAPIRHAIQVFICFMDGVARKAGLSNALLDGWPNLPIVVYAHSALGVQWCVSEELQQPGQRRVLSYGSLF